MTITYGRFGAASGQIVRLDREEALRYLGYAGQQVDDALLARFHALADECERVIEPGYAWGIFDIDDGAAVANAGGAADPCGVASARGVASAGAAADPRGAAASAAEAPVAAPAAADPRGAEIPRVALAFAPVVLSGNDIASHLEGARKVALMACTLGMASEREYRRHAALSAADGAMFGACCSALVEAAANAVEARIVAEARRLNMYTNWRYSPGYGDLPLDVQPDFLRSLDATRKLGINVTKTNMLVPVKSITAVVGLFDEKEGAGPAGTPQVAADASGASHAGDATCAACPAFQDCEFRKRGCTCHG